MVRRMICFWALNGLTTVPIEVMYLILLTDANMYSFLVCKNFLSKHTSILYMYLYVCMCMYLYAYVCMYVYVCIGMYVCMYVCMCVYVCMHACMHVYVQYMCIYMHVCV